MKKKVLSLTLAAGLLAVAAISGSLAYFTDTDTQKNTFTVGGVSIVQHEMGADEKEFKQNQVLMPLPKNDRTNDLYIDKIVTVENTGKSNAYVRTFIAVPKDLDKEKAIDNVLHWNFTKDTEDYWYWATDYTGASVDKGGDFKAFEMTVDKVVYNVYCATYKTAVEPGKDKATKPSLVGLYLDKSVNMEKIGDELNYFYIQPTTGKKVSFGDISNVQVLVASQACQEAGFTNPFDALKESFGEPKAQTAEALGWTK